MSKIKNRKKKIMFAIADRETEDYLKTVIKEDCPDTEIVGIVTYKEKVIQKVNQLEPDILLLRETLPGTLNITELLFELRYSYPNVRIIFLAGDRKPGDTFLITLVTYGIHDLLIGGHHKISDIIELINIPNTFKDINHLIPKATLNEVTNSMQFASPLIVETSKKNVVVIEEDRKNTKIDKVNSHKNKIKLGNMKNKKEKVDNNLKINKNIKNDELLIDDNQYDDDFKFDYDDTNYKNQLPTSIIEEDRISKQYNNSNNSTKKMSKIDEIFEEDEDDIDFVFGFDDTNSESKDDFNDTNSESKDDFNDTNSESKDDIDFVFDFDDTSLENEDNIKTNINNKQFNSKEDSNLGNNDFIFEDEDFMIDIDINDIKDNKDIPINDILIEEEHEDLSLKDKSTKNESNEFKIEKSNEINSNSKYKYKNKKDKKQISKNIEENYNLKDLAKEIDSLNEKNKIGLDMIEEDYINNINYNNDMFIDSSDDFEQEFISSKNNKKEKPTKTIFSKNSNNSNVIISRQKIISFIGGKGGIGTSSIAINSATKLAQSGYKVIYIELNSIHPTIGYWYQIGHLNKGIETAVKSVENGRLEEINKSIIKASLLKKENKKLYKNLSSNLDFLLFSKQETILKDKNKSFNPNALKDLFLKLMIDIGYDFVVLDLDFDLNNMYTITSLNFSNSIYSVISQDVSSLAYLLFKIEELEKKGYKIKDKSKYIINRYENNGVEISLKNLKEWLNCKNLYTIPNNNKDFINANALSIPLISYTRDEKIQKCFEDIISNILSDC